ncbi:cobalamin-dependent protein [Bradyrhizobium sp. SZCCHNR2035]|uniref:cobalamin-dependent protein n=1 Tax=Bradyrhizobium sp. SZCCHNR2035 TaxID=3057386 RepID=UPI002916F0F6|nr:cobalamin-dependent protein [Bradyrhizobium sp. SZCCHNR2035]
MAILDMRSSAADHHRHIYKSVTWEQKYTIDVERVGTPFSASDAYVEASDWVGISSHFTFESGIIRDLIRHIKRLKPTVKVMVGGADVKARPHDYLAFGADLAFVGDCNPAAIRDYTDGQRIVGPYSHPFNELTSLAFDKLPNLSDYVDSHDGPVPHGVSCPIGFVYFTRGCPRECDFCESRRSSFERLSLDDSLTMLERYRQAGIHTLNFSDDNLLIIAAKDQGRRELISLFERMRHMGFAWEFPNGLELGRFIRNGVVDTELMDAMFSHSIDSSSGRLIGAYRVYVPLETFERRSEYKKLRQIDEQNSVIEKLAGIGLPELDFGVVLPPSATGETFAATRDGYMTVRHIVGTNGNTKARYAVFHLIPIATYRSMKTKYSVHEFPEGWNFHFPVYDGEHFNARELFEQRLRLIKDVDPVNYQSMRFGRYSYG